jgi:hypothetical protein
LQTLSGEWLKLGLRISDWDAIEIYTLKESNLGKVVYKLQREIRPPYFD